MVRFFLTPEAEAKIAEHGVTPDEVEYVLQHPQVREVSHSSDRMIAKGYTPNGRWLICVYELIDEITVMPITVYSPERQ